MFDLKDLLIENPITLIDVGAAGGLHPRFQAVGDNLNCILFEPEKSAYQALINSDPKRTVHHVALDEVPGERLLYITRKRECSSFFLPNAPWLNSFPDPERFAVEDEVSVKTSNLDALLEPDDSIDLIKIDAQGGELSILRGAQRTLQKVLALEIEVEFNGIYQQQPLFADIDGFLRRFGFELFDLRRYHWSRRTLPSLRRARGQIVFADALYFKSLDALESEQSGADHLARLKRFIAILLLYQRNDYALEVLGRFASQNNSDLDEVEYDQIARLCKTYNSATTVPDFRGKGRIRAFLSKLLVTGAAYSADEEL